MRKILDQNFWSHGTPLGSLGPLSREDPILGFDQHQIPVIWGPYEPPVVVALETFAENPKMAGSWCARVMLHNDNRTVAAIRCRNTT